jgi:acyl-CoA synthetase (AMP-forming)/AMP-acid ligase II
MVDEEISTNIDDIAFIVYTSGTTGKAKGVQLTLRSMLWVVAACWIPIAELNDKDVVLSPLPLFHSYALNLSALSIVAAGASEFIVEKYSSSQVLSLLKTGKFTVLPGVPTMFHYILESAKADSDVKLNGILKRQLNVKLVGCLPCMALPLNSTNRCMKISKANVKYVILRQQQSVICTLTTATAQIK